MTAETMVWNVNFETQEQADKFNSFNKLLSEDTSTLEALDNASSLEEFFNVCKKYINCTFEEFHKLYNRLSDQMSNIYEETFGPRELNDDELDIVVGGSWKSFWKKVGKIALGVVVAIGAVAACAVTAGAAGAAIGAIGAAVAGTAVASAATAGAVSGAIGGIALGASAAIKK
ncbi:hypothetical protein [Megamonas rupellensis]|uniref:hypothetical protein n=1 Tax=Megamonas rupellensis TaxID=491921 RepID=UPI0019567756|nr:hypothetical protein [Megamonas rupellensis]MBM6749522.1 hypothetical protein [Megamonas rupellensis]